MLFPQSHATLHRLSPLIRAAELRLLSSWAGTGETWLQGLIHRKELEPQSHILSMSPSIYEFQVHEVRPQCMLDYLNEFEHFLNLLSRSGSQAQVVGSWTCDIGDEDVAYHLWKHPSGYLCLDEHAELCRRNKDIVEYAQRRNAMLRCRKNQICLPFSFWPEPSPNRGSKNLYELRSYTLRPGTMVEWGNHWARGLPLRSKNMTAVAGLFSHIGEMQVVHHLWAYPNLEARRKSRDLSWQEQGWNACVMKTVPLIRSMRSSILRPNSFSPMQ